MIEKILEWLLGFFKEKSEDQQWLEDKIEEKEQELEEIENEENSDDDLDEYLNK